MNVQPPQITPRQPPGARWFWFALLMPAVMALLTYLFSTGGANDSGFFVGSIGCVVGGVSAVYCGVWLARRFVKDQAGRVLLAVVAMVVLAFVNLFIVVAGCAANVSFH